MSERFGALERGRARIDELARRAVGLVPYRLRQSREFWEFYTYLDAAQFASREELEEEQFRRLRGALQHAYQHSAFYRRLYDEHGVEPRRIHSFDDFRKRVPVVDRSMLQGATDLTVSMPGMAITKTSGTTGSPFAFYANPSALALDMAAIFHQWSRAGFRPGDERVEMRGVQRAPIRRLADSAITRISVINMEAHLGEIVAHLNRRKIPFLHGYPSALAKFALLLRERGWRLDYPLKAAFLASENVFAWQTEIISEVLEPAILIAHYGTAERTALGAWCEERRAYHFIPAYGYLEAGPRGEAITTGFLNRSTPFIRYRTSDVLVDPSPSPCSDCGRGYAPVVGDIGGRLEDYLVSDRGELLPPAVATFPFKDLRWIRSLQIVQRADRSVVLRCVSDPGPAEAVERERAAVRRDMQVLLGAGIPVGFEDVQEIPLTGGCKFQWIVSEAAKQVFG